MPAEAKRPWNLLKNPGDFKAFMGNTKNKSLVEKYVHGNTSNKTKTEINHKNSQNKREGL